MVKTTSKLIVSAAMLFALAGIVVGQEKKPGFMVSVYQTSHLEDRRPWKDQFTGGFPFSGEFFTLSEHKNHGSFLSTLPGEVSYRLDGYIDVEWGSPTAFTVHAKMPPLGFYCKAHSCMNAYFADEPGLYRRFLNEYHADWNLTAGRHSNPEYDRLPKEPEKVQAVKEAGVKCNVELFVDANPSPLLSYTFDTTFGRKKHPWIFPNPQPTHQICGYIDSATATTQLSRGKHYLRYYVRCPSFRTFTNPNAQKAGIEYFDYCNQRKSTNLDNLPGDEVQFRFSSTQLGKRLPGPIKVYHE